MRFESASSAPFVRLSSGEQLPVRSVWPVAVGIGSNPASALEENPRALPRTASQPPKWMPVAVLLTLAGVLSLTTLHSHTEAEAIVTSADDLARGDWDGESAAAVADTAAAFRLPADDRTRAVRWCGSR